MKLASLTVLGAAAALAACGTTGSSTTAQPASSTDADTDIDYATVNAINNVARSRGVQVIWFHYPQKPVKSTSGSPE